MVVPIDGAKEIQKERQPLLWYAFLLALGSSKPLCELSRALTALKREDPAIPHPQAVLNLLQVAYSRLVRDMVTAVRLPLPGSWNSHRYCFMSW